MGLVRTMLVSAQPSRWPILAGCGISVGLLVFVCGTLLSTLRDSAAEPSDEIQTQMVSPKLSFAPISAETQTKITKMVSPQLRFTPTSAKPQTKMVSPKLNFAPISAETQTEKVSPKLNFAPISAETQTRVTSPKLSFAPISSNINGAANLEGCFARNRTNKNVFKSQKREDWLIYMNYFCDFKGPGTYLEIGAYDGLLHSNTHFFEHVLGWHGVLIEAQPSNAKALDRNRGGSGKNHIFKQATCAEGRHFVEFTGTDDTLGAVTETDQWKSHDSSNFWALKKLPPKLHSYKVPCQPLGAMLRQAGVQIVDFFSLDCEGSELAVLETMDWSIPVRVFLVEMLGQDPVKDQGIRKLLRKHGYHRPANRWDWHVMERRCAKYRGTGAVLKFGNGTSKFFKKGHSRWNTCTEHEIEAGHTTECCLAWFGQEVWLHPYLVSEDDVKI